MRAGIFILLIGTAVVVGWIAPGLSTGSSEGGQAKLAKVSRSPDKHAKAEREAWLTGATVLERAGDGHFYLDARVDGHATHFLVDTGASVVALTGEDAQAAGLDWRDDDVVAIGRGASGTVYGVPVRLDSLEVDGIRASDVDAAIIPEGLDVSLLGQTFLARVKAVRMDGDTMVLDNSN